MTDAPQPGSRATGTPALGRHSRIAALVPHYRCEQWLGQCLESLLEQTRAPDAIVVIDDGSPTPPVDIVSRFPSVTLLRTPTNAGLFRVLQQGVQDTDFDGYLLQDADDWSGPRRLELLLEEAERTGAELIGCGEMRIHLEDLEVEPRSYPPDVDSVIRSLPFSYPLLHPSSVVSRSLVTRLGGYASGMRFSGDAEFVRRAVFAARVTNIRHFCYFRRIRPGALTTSPETGLDSPARKRVRYLLAQRSRTLASRAEKGWKLDLTPFSVAPPIPLEHLLGPDVRRGEAASPPAPRPRTAGRGAAPAGGLRAAGRPIFLIGAPGSGLGLLHAALAQHPGLAPVSASAWLSRFQEQLERSLAELALDPLRDTGAGPGPREEGLRSLGDALHHLIAGCPGRWVDGASGYALTIPRLRELFPDALFLHLVRDPAEVVRLLRERPSPETPSTTAEPVRRWLDHVGAALEAERALGPGVVRRIDRARLLADPEGAMREVLAFVGEPYRPVCERPLTAGGPDGPPTAGRGPAASLGAEAPGPEEDALSYWARLVYRDVLSAPPSRGSGAAPAGPTGLAALATPALPAGSVPLVLSYGDDGLLAFGAVRGLHFPGDEEGGYLGYNPETGESAVARLRAALARGATHLVLPRDSFWWLDHYPGFGTYLESHGGLVAFAEEVGAVFSLQPAGSVRPRASVR